MAPPSFISLLGGSGPDGEPAASGAGGDHAIELEDGIGDVVAVGVGDGGKADDLGGPAGDVGGVGLDGDFELAVLVLAMVVGEAHHADPVGARAHIGDL